MKNFLCVLFLLVLVSCDKQKEELTLEKGISFELAKYRKQQISDVLYNLHFKIPKEKKHPIAAILEINFKVRDFKNDVFLDFNEATLKLKSIKINGKKSAMKHQKEHLIIDKTKLTLGENVLEIRFDAGETSLNRNEEFLYTLLVPDRASTLFPCYSTGGLESISRSF
jgi:aminopeptidase N